MGNASAAPRESFNVAPNRHEMLRFAPLILAALYRAHDRRSAPIHRVLVVLEEHGHDVGAMTWGELCAIVCEARAIGDLRPRDWEARARGRLLPMSFGYPAAHPVAELALHDDTLAALLVRADAWRQHLPA